VWCIGIAPVCCCPLHPGLMLSLVATPLSLVQTGAMPMHHTLAPMSDVFMGAKAKPKPKKTASAAPAAPKKKITTLKTIGTYIDVTGKEYQEANVFIPQFDEIGVLPPIGRWDPLKIREQVGCSPASCEPSEGHLTPSSKCGQTSNSGVDLTPLLHALAGP